MLFQNLLVRVDEKSARPARQIANVLARLRIHHFSVYEVAFTAAVNH
jgi:hypothetical protein